MVSVWLCPVSPKSAHGFTEVDCCKPWKQLTRKHHQCRPGLTEFHCYCWSVFISDGHLWAAGNYLGARIGTHLTSNFRRSTHSQIFSSASRRSSKHRISCGAGLDPRIGSGARAESERCSNRRKRCQGKVAGSKMTICSALHSKIVLRRQTLKKIRKRFYKTFLACSNPASKFRNYKNTLIWFTTVLDEIWLLIVAQEKWLLLKACSAIGIFGETCMCMIVLLCGRCSIVSCTLRHRDKVAEQNEHLKFLTRFLAKTQEPSENLGNRSQWDIVMNINFVNVTNKMNSPLKFSQSNSR